MNLHALVVMASAVTAATTFGAVTPYAADSNTLALYHFNETAGAADPGTPFGNAGSNGIVLDNTGGPDGRDNTGAGGYGGAALAGFGSSLDVVNSGNGAYATTSSATSGGARTMNAVAQSSLQGADGAFTYEALINISSLTGEQTILSHDGLPSGTGTTNRGFMLRIDTTGKLSFYHGTGTTTSLALALPTTGDHAFSANEWFHVAVSYDGIANGASNLKLYWTRADAAVDQANLLGSGTLTVDLSNVADTNWFGVGSTTRGEFRFQPKGFVDEVRISDVARGPDEFLFAAVPEPSSIAVLGLAGAALISRRRA